MDLRALVLPLVLSAAPVQLPKCSSGELIVATDQGYRCASFKSLLEEQRSSASWGAENVLPTCSSGQFLQSEGFGKWRCLEADKVIPSCSSGETLRSEGYSSGWKCDRKPQMPSCSSGEVWVSEGGDSWRCRRFKD